VDGLFAARKREDAAWQREAGVTNFVQMRALKLA
jgi:hypothetical protein